MKNKPLSFLIVALIVIIGVGGVIVLLVAFGIGAYLTTARTSGEQPTPVIEYSSPFDPHAAPGNPVITLERTACFGTCPIYTLAIYEDGRVEYVGQDFVTVKGEQTGSITAEQIQELVAAFQDADYFNLQDEYTAPVTDLPTTITSFTFDGKTKTIRNYGGCLDGMLVPAPQALCELENKIDEVTNSAQWVGK